MDVDDDRSVIPEITPARFAQLRADGIVADGMLPKLENAFDAIEHGVRSVAICRADAVAEKGYGGTTLKADDSAKAGRRMSSDAPVQGIPETARAGGTA